MHDVIEYEWIPGQWASPRLLAECAELYSAHYGVWSKASPYKPGGAIRLSPDRLREWTRSPDSRIALARLHGRLVGYAMAVQTRIPRYGIVSWITQFVVHQEHRNRRIGTTLLFSVWGFTDHFAWGLITANPYAVRALEKATRRRCDPSRIAKNKVKLRRVGIANVNYVKVDTPVDVTSSESRIKTNFFVDHSTLEAKLADVGRGDTPWTLGPIDEGWEWLAFTFHDQPQIRLTPQETRRMVEAADQVAQHAYSRMALSSSHKWAQHSAKESQQVKEYCGLVKGDRLIDFGCGTGRHALELASMGLNVTGVDYVEGFVEVANKAAAERNISSAAFIVGDCRTIDLGYQADAAICLYDVIGTYAENDENQRILRNIAQHLRSGGRALISVMNRELTERKALHWFAIDEEPDKLLELEPSRTMEQTGNIFNPNHYMIDHRTRVVYRKEQFASGHRLPTELIVRDRRFTREEIEAMCRSAGLGVVWSRFVQAGKWEVPLTATADQAKELLILCEKR